MILIIIIKSILLGFLISIPIWPIGIICLKRGISNGKTSGIISSLGFTTANAISVFICMYFLTIVTDFIEKEKFFFDYLVGLLLIILGLKKLIFKSDTKSNNNISYYSRLQEFLIPFIFILSNPITYTWLSSILLIFDLLKYKLRLITSIQISLGVFFGSTLLWLMLINIIDIKRKHFNETFIYKINKIGNIFLLIIGIVLITKMILGRYFF
jgi:threonine/homoserine/homoserine lactone efflux protein